MWVLQRNIEKEKSWGTLFNSQYFKGRGACWNYGMGLGQIHKQEFKMGSTYICKKRKRLVQIEWKWYGELSKDNLKHKLYTAHNLWEEAPLPSLWYIMCLSAGTTSKCHFSSRLPNRSLKTRILVVSQLWMFTSFSNQVFYKKKGQYFITLKKIFPVVYNMPQLELI